MDESSFFSLSVRLSQSQRDKLIHARRLKAAGQGNPLGVEVPKCVQSLQHKLVELQRKEERQLEAARRALQAVGETQTQLLETKAQLETAKAEAAKALVGSPSAQAQATIQGMDEQLTQFLASFAEGLASADGVEARKKKLEESVGQFKSTLGAAFSAMGSQPVAATGAPPDAGAAEGAGPPAAATGGAVAPPSQAQAPVETGQPTSQDVGMAAVSARADDPSLDSQQQQRERFIQVGMERLKRADFRSRSPPPGSVDKRL